MQRNIKTALETGREYQQHVIPEINRSRQYLMIIVTVTSSIAITSMIALMLLMPLKEKVPVPILVDRTTGDTQVVNNSIDINTLSVVDVLDRYWINLYVHARETFNLVTLESHYETVKRLSCPKTFQEYDYLFSGNNPNNYYTVYKNHTVDVNIKSINRFHDPALRAEQYRTYTVHAERLIVPDAISQGADSIKRIPYQILIAVKFTQLSVEERLIRDNPLGFVACHFSRDQYVEGQQ